MPARFIGAHMPTAGGLDKAVQNGKDIGCTAIQVFTSSPRQWKSKEVTEEASRAFKQACSVTGIAEHTVSHDSYLINLAAPDDEFQQKSKAGLLRELARSHDYGIPFVVSHIGAHMGQGTDVGLARAANMIKEILHESPSDVTLLAETTAGQGSALNSSFEEIAKLIELCGTPARLAVCLDTCHIFSAGYDIRTPETYEATMRSFDQLIGLDRLKVVHCNDSKTEFASRKDRHEHLGLGTIGEQGFKCLVRDQRMENVLIVVETPDAETKHAENVAKLWDWARA